MIDFLFFFLRPLFTSQENAYTSPRIIGLLPSTIVIYSISFILLLLNIEKLRPHLRNVAIKCLIILAVPEIFTFLTYIVINPPIAVETLRSIGDIFLFASVVLLLSIRYKGNVGRFWQNISLLMVVSTLYGIWTLVSQNIVIDEYHRVLSFWGGAFRLSNISTISFCGLYTYSMSQPTVKRIIKVGLVSSFVGILLSGHRAGLMFALAFLFLMHFMGKGKRVPLKYTAAALLVVGIFFSLQPSYLERFAPMLKEGFGYFYNPDKTVLLEQGVTEATMLYRTWILAQVLEETTNSNLLVMLFGHGAKQIYKQTLVTSTQVIEIADPGTAYSWMLYDFGVIKIIAFFYMIYFVVFRTKYYNQLVPINLTGLRLIFLLLIPLSFAESVFNESTIGLYFWGIVAMTSIPIARN